MTLSQDEITSLERELALDFYSAVQDWSNQTERSLQEQDKVIGVSNIGHCSEYVRRLLINEEPSQEPDKLAAFLGTWIGAGIEQAILARHPEAIIQSEITITLDTDQGTFQITGHPDIVFAVLGDQGIVIDCKTVNQLSSVTSYAVFEENLQKKFQRHLYAKGCHDAGMFGDTPLEDILVGNLWADRSGQDKHFHVRLEPYSSEVVDHAREWLSGVVYAYKNNIEAAREPQRTFCENWCEFFGPCRGADTDVEGLITDPRVITAIDLYKEGGAMESAGKKMKAQAKTELEGVSGSTGQWVVREIEVGETTIPATTRRGYRRLSITKAK
jgi:hypothetical protein